MTHRELTWDYDGDGRWEAYSQIGDEGSPFVYRIEVTEGGGFDVNGSDSELVGIARTTAYPTLETAKKWCAGNEVLIVGTVIEERE